MKRVIFGVLFLLLSVLSLSIIQTASVVEPSPTNVVATCDITKSPSTIYASDFTFSNDGLVRVTVYGYGEGKFSDETSVKIDCNSDNAKPESKEKTISARITPSPSSLSYTSSCYYKQPETETKYRVSATINPDKSTCKPLSTGDDIILIPGSGKKERVKEEEKKNETEKSETKNDSDNPPEVPNDETTFKLIISPKFSFIGLPYAESRLIKSSCDDFKAYTYNSIEKKYVKVNLKSALSDPVSYSGKGIIVKAPSECKAEFSGEFVSEQTLKLESGWNLISFQKIFTDDDNYATNCKFLSPYWEYDSKKKEYQESKNWAPGKAYWVRVKEKCFIETKNAVDESRPPLVPNVIKELFKK